MNNARSNQRMPSGNDKTALLEQIRALGFVKVELELYLDTHPECATALDYYRQTVNALKDMTELYESMYGPLTAAGNQNSDRWDWVNSPWPWHRDDENTDNRWHTDDKNTDRWHRDDENTDNRWHRG